MLNVMKELRSLQLESEQLNISNPGYHMDNFSLDFHKIGASSTIENRYPDLPQWMLNNRPANGYSSYLEIQKVFDRFFIPAGPKVMADDTANTLIGANDSMEYSTDGGKTWVNYDPSHAPTFTGNITVKIRVKASGDKELGDVTTVTFTENPITQLPNDEGEVSSPVHKEEIVVDVDGEDGVNLTRTPITRTTDANGIVKDHVSMSEKIAKETVDKAKQLGVDTASIIIPDKNDKVSEILVEIPKSSLKQLNDAKLMLRIVTENGIISIPTKSISNFSDDLFFRIIPIKSEEQRKQVEERAKKEKIIQDAVKNKMVKILGRPMEIETNMQNHEVSIVLPLKDSLPLDLTERTEVLNHLGIFIEHSDGTKELIKGLLVKMQDGSDGIEFKVNKFSTFTLIYLDDWMDAQPKAHHSYIKGFGDEFRPNTFVTRAQMAAMLSRNLTNIDASGPQNSYIDVTQKHWAYAEIMKSKSVGIMMGTTMNNFEPEGSITRAQMATIAYRWIQRECTMDATASNNCSVLSNNNELSYKDVPSKHWAMKAITFMKSTNFMVGYGDDTFKPNKKLTRAEAVKVLNRLFKRGPLTGVKNTTFNDVPTSFWAFNDIEEAARDHQYIANDNEEEIVN